MSILAPRIPGSRFLDLFAGTGSVGVEALSRGAAHATFVERAASALADIRHNLGATHLAANAEVAGTNVFAYLRGTPAPFDVIFVAPPQWRGLWTWAVQLLDQRPGWRAPGWGDRGPARSVREHRRPAPAPAGVRRADVRSGPLHVLRPPGRLGQAARVSGVGWSALSGQSYRMTVTARAVCRGGIDVAVGHGRREVHAVTRLEQVALEPDGDLQAPAHHQHHLGAAMCTGAGVDSVPGS